MGGVILVFTWLQHKYAAFLLQIYSCSTRNAAILKGWPFCRIDIAIHTLLSRFAGTLTSYPTVRGGYLFDEECAAVLAVGVWIIGGLLEGYF